jgi:phage-related protein
MRTAWDAGKRAVGTAIVGIVEFARKLPGQILAALGNLSALLISQGTGLILGLARGIGAAVGGLIESIRGLPGRILSGLGSLGSLLYDAGRALIRGFINGIGSMAGELARKARDVALTPVNVVKGVLGIGSPSKVFAALGRDSVAGYVQGFEQAARGMSGVVGMLSPVPTAGAAAGHWSTTGSRLAPVQPLQINGPIITNRTLAAELIADITAAGRRAGVGV